MGDRFFYEFHWQQRAGLLKHQSSIADKTRRMLAVIPADVATILDIGCGDGAITNQLAKHYDVTAIDRSSAALRHLADNVTALQMDAAEIDLPQRYADLVLSSEMLEHIPEITFPKVVAQLERLADRYLLISVPNREELRQRRTRCLHCGLEFHIYRHFRRFTVRRVASLFPTWKVRAAFSCGSDESPTLAFVSAVRNRIVRSFFYGIQGDTPCPRCGDTIQRPKLNQAQRVASAALNLLEAWLLKALHRKPYPDWLVVLLVR